MFAKVLLAISKVSEWLVSFSSQATETTVLFQSSPSQVWFIENVGQPGFDALYAKREIEEGKYLIQSVSDRTRYINIKSTPWRCLLGTDNKTKVSACQVFNVSADQRILYT